MAASIGDKHLLQRKIIRNPKYENITSKLDTGASMTKYLRKVEDLQNNFKIRPNEIFKRIKLSSFCELMIETALAHQMKQVDASLEPVVEEENQNPETVTARRSYTKLEDVITGVGTTELQKGDLNQNIPLKQNLSQTSIQDQIYENSPFLLIDTQFSEDYEKCHIRPAINYDPAELSRVMNPYNPLLLKYINKPDKIIVVYDQNEESAVRVVTNLAERNVSNVFLLSGGLKLIANRDLHVLVTGPYPKSIFAEELAKNNRPRAAGRPKAFKIPGLNQVEDPHRKIFVEGEIAELGRELNRYLQMTAPSTARSVRSVRSTTTVGTSVSSRAWR